MKNIRFPFSEQISVDPAPTAVIAPNSIAGIIGDEKAPTANAMKNTARVALNLFFAEQNITAAEVTQLIHDTV